MQCNWDNDPKSYTHIPKMCGRDAVVIFECRYRVIFLCSEHYERQKSLHSDKGMEISGWQKMTPDEYVVRRVMSE